LKEEQKTQARMERQAALLVKKQAKTLKVIRKNLNKAAPLLRKAPVLLKVRVVVS